MNRYTINTPYSFRRGGTLSYNVYAESEDEAIEKCSNQGNRYSEDYCDEDDNDYEWQYEWEDSTVNEIEEGVNPDFGDENEVPYFPTHQASEVAKPWLSMNNNLDDIDKL